MSQAGRLSFLEQMRRMRRKLMLRKETGKKKKGIKQLMIYKMTEGQTGCPFLDVMKYS